MILNGRLPRVWRRRGVSGYLSVLVNAEETRDLVRRMDHGGLSLREVEQRMRCSTRVVKELVDHGHLPSRIAANPVNRGLQRIVHTAALEGFLVRFILLHSPAAERGRHFLNLHEALEM